MIYPKILIRRGDFTTPGLSLTLSKGELLYDYNSKTLFMTDPDGTYSGVKINNQYNFNSDSFDIQGTSVSGAFMYQNKQVYLKAATTSTLGGIKVGSGLSIDGNGVLSATSIGGGGVELGTTNTGLKVGGWHNCQSYESNDARLVGVATTAARSDHSHQLEACSTTTVGGLMINNYQTQMNNCTLEIILIDGGEFQLGVEIPIEVE
jgi:hypothetical protein